jgi:hypothetical protein
MSPSSRIRSMRTATDWWLLSTVGFLERLDRHPRAVNVLPKAVAKIVADANNIKIKMRYAVRHHPNRLVGLGCLVVVSEGLSQRQKTVVLHRHIKNRRLAAVGPIWAPVSPGRTPPLRRPQRRRRLEPPSPTTPVQQIPRPTAPLPANRPALQRTPGVSTSSPARGLTRNVVRFFLQGVGSRALRISAGLG